MADLNCLFVGFEYTGPSYSDPELPITILDTFAGPQLLLHNDHTIAVLAVQAATLGDLGYDLQGEQLLFPVFTSSGHKFWVTAGAADCLRADSPQYNIIERTADCHSDDVTRYVGAEYLRAFLSDYLMGVEKWEFAPEDPETQEQQLYVLKSMLEQLGMAALCTLHMAETDPEDDDSDLLIAVEMACPDGSGLILESDGAMITSAPSTMQQQVISRSLQQRWGPKASLYPAHDYLC